MAKRLTTFSKFLITLLIVAAAVFLFNYISGGKLLQNLGTNTDGTIFSDTDSNSGSAASDDVIKVGVVTWGGYAGGQYFNEGFKASSKSRYKKEYGIDVEFVVNDDVDASLNAWKSGDIDVHWYTIDAFPTILPGLSDFDPVVLWQADWSRGGDAIVAQRGINSVADLRGKKIAVAELTPSHSFLLYMLDAGEMSVNDVEIIPQASAIDAAAAFKSRRVDAAVVWSPDDEQCLRDVPGSRILNSTRSASNIIADIFFAKKEYAEANRDALQKLYEGWMIGAAEINGSDQAKQKAAGILAEGLGIPESDALAAINNVRLVTHGDNQNFFGLNTGFRGVTGDDLYQRMADEYSQLGFLEGRIPAWRSISMPYYVQQTNLSGEANASEASRTFAPVSEDEGRQAEAIASKPVSISFRTGEYTLDENAKRIIDDQFIPIAQAFANARIRIEGNTDNVGSRSSNIRLSEQRANSVKNYLVREYGMSANRFIVIGNGPDNPIADNSTDRGRSQNRRTDFQIIRE